MKYYVEITNEGGKKVGKGGDEYIDIDIMRGNTRIMALTVRDGKVFDKYDNELTGSIDSLHSGYCNWCGSKKTHWMR